jgi:hypothetical protein
LRIWREKKERLDAKNNRKKICCRSCRKRRNAGERRCCRQLCGGNGIPEDSAPLLEPCSKLSRIGGNIYMGLGAGMRTAIASQMERCGIIAGMDRFMHMMMVCFIMCIGDMSSRSVRFRRVFMDTLRLRHAGTHHSAICLYGSARQKHTDQNQSCCDSQSHLKPVRLQLYVLPCRRSKARALLSGL